MGTKNNFRDENVSVNKVEEAKKEQFTEEEINFSWHCFKNFSFLLYAFLDLIFFDFSRCMV